MKSMGEKRHMDSLKKPKVSIQHSSYTVKFISYTQSLVNPWLNEGKYQVLQKLIQVFLKPKNKLVDSGTCIKSPIVTNELQAPPPYDSFLYLK